MSKKNQCKDCTYFQSHRNSGISGECYYGPPTANKNPHGWSMHPRTKGDSWCSKWEPRKELDTCSYVDYKNEGSVCPATAIVCPGWKDCPYYKNVKEENLNSSIPGQYRLWRCKCDALNNIWTDKCGYCNNNRPDDIAEGTFSIVKICGREYIIWAKVEDVPTE